MKQGIDPCIEKQPGDEQLWRRSVRILVLIVSGVEAAWIALYVWKLVHRS